MTHHDWFGLLFKCGVRTTTAVRWSTVFASTIKPETFSKGEAELAPFLGQILHESGMLERLEENLNYTAERLMQVWPKRFPTLMSAQPYASDPIALANHVYGGRMGNQWADDGWRYRGRSLIQVTGKANYKMVGALMGQDLLNMPDLLAQPHFALEAAILWWEDVINDSMIEDVERVTRRINGGIHGLADRQRLTDLATEALA